jgi:hypothetical protein
MDSARLTLGLRPSFVMAVLVTATCVLRPRVEELADSINLGV